MSTSEAVNRVLDAVAERLRRAQSVLFITGAGISADSGLPTYRGVGGLYNDSTTDEGLAIEELLSAQVFAVRPDLTWKYLAQIESACRGAAPNAAHRAIAELESRLPRTTVLTQNVDGLHRQAGSRNVIEIHGNLQQLHCPLCGFEERADSLAGRELPPLCPVCASVLRPKVVLFGEALPEGAIARLVAAADEGFDMVFSIGTSSVFPYITQPVLWAVDAGVATVEINPQQTQLSGVVDHYLPLGAAQAMNGLMERLAR